MASDSSGGREAALRSKLDEALSALAYLARNPLVSEWLRRRGVPTQAPAGADLVAVSAAVDRLRSAARQDVDAWHESRSLKGVPLPISDVHLEAIQAAVAGMFGTVAAESFRRATDEYLLRRNRLIIAEVLPDVPPSEAPDERLVLWGASLLEVLEECRRLDTLLLRRLAPLAELLDLMRLPGLAMAVREAVERPTPARRPDQERFAMILGAYMTEWRRAKRDREKGKSAIIIPEGNRPAAKRKGRLPKEESQAKRAHLLALAREHPTLRSDVVRLADLVKVSESTARRWLDEEEQKFLESRAARVAREED